MSCIFSKAFTRSNRRGDVRILDRDKLIKIAGGCYGVPEQEYERLIASPGRLAVHPAGSLNGHHAIVAR